MTDLRQVFDDLVRFETMLWAAVDERLQRESELSLGSFNVMLIIDSTPSCRVFDIAQAVVITVGGASQAVDRLEKSGWCIRTPHPTDRRSSVVELTAEGKKLFDRAAPVFDDELQRLLGSPLAATGRAHLAEGLHTLRGSIAKRAAVTE
ncbi:MarR family winged helix-turn-helix transcriptional regulator [Parafrigoribacterium soli]|uniref:MarR family winged helix-turn-helix transcriptional regulator n=1 Tax=Parafrigoribacterium soli TaxID=3144663 RepID=UPI0032EED55B